MERQIVVVGLYGMSLLLHAKKFPCAGQTISGEMLALEPGGKGFNQAVSAARNGGQATFVTAVGEDVFGKQFFEMCEKYGVKGICTCLPKSKTAAAAVLSDEVGESRVIVAQGACADARAECFDFDKLPQQAIWLLQHEMSCGVNLAAARMAKRTGGTVILNPAPARPVGKELLALTDYLIPNWGEALAITGLDATALPRQVAEKLHAFGVENVLITMGEQGVWLSQREGTALHIPAYKVHVVDTTGAGDTFCGAFAACLAKGEPMHQAARYANCASGLSVTRKGVMKAIPFEDEVRKFVREQVSQIIS